MDAYKKLFLNKSFNKPLPVSEIANQLQHYKEDKFKIKKISDLEYKILANLSIGTATGTGPSEGIKIYVSLNATSQSVTQIILKSKLRNELKIWIAAMIILCIVGLFKLHDNKSFFFTSLATLPVGLVWFWVLYGYQERLLASKVEGYLLSLS